MSGKEYISIYLIKWYSLSLKHGYKFHFSSLKSLKWKTQGPIQVLTSPDTGLSQPDPPAVLFMTGQPRRGVNQKGASFKNQQRIPLTKKMLMHVLLILDEKP